MPCEGHPLARLIDNNFLTDLANANKPRNTMRSSPADDQPICANAAASGSSTAGVSGGRRYTMARSSPASPSAAAWSAVADAPAAGSNFTCDDSMISRGSRPMSAQWACRTSRLRANSCGEPPVVF